MIVAVYGSLRKGFENHFHLSGSGSTFLRTDSLTGFDLYAAEYPYMTRGSGQVVVELYDVSPEVLARLDELEGHPGLYERTTVRSDSGLEAQAYLMPRERMPSDAEPIAGDWSSARPRRGVDTQGRQSLDGK